MSDLTASNKRGAKLALTGIALLVLSFPLTVFGGKLLIPVFTRPGAQVITITEMAIGIGCLFVGFFQFVRADKSANPH